MDGRLISLFFRDSLVKERRGMLDLIVGVGCEMDGVDLPSLGVVFFLKRKKGGLEARCSCFLGGRVDDGRPGHGLCVDPYLGFFFEKKSCLFFS